MSGAGPAGVDTSHVRTPARTPAPWPRGASSPRPDPRPPAPAHLAVAALARRPPGRALLGQRRAGARAGWCPWRRLGQAGWPSSRRPQVSPEKDLCPMLTAPKPGAARSERQGAQGSPTLRFSASERSPACQPDDSLGSCGGRSEGPARGPTQDRRPVLRRGLLG